MRLNVPTIHPPIHTHEGGPARHISAESQLRRTVLSCLLWENQFYESGQDIASRITELAAKCPAKTVAALAVEARKTFNLRHVPLLLLCDLVRRPDAATFAAAAIGHVLSRADECAELLAVYWRNGRCPIDRQLRRGLAIALSKFDEYRLAKYDREGPIKLRDVFRIARPKPSSPEQAALWGRAVRRELAIPDTWEVALSAGADKRDTWMRLLSQDKLGYLALLRNLRNMDKAGVPPEMIGEAIRARKGGAERVFPFRYIAACRAAPQHAIALDEALQSAIRELPALPGRTFILVDVSGSMSDKLSGKSDLSRMDAAAALAAIWPNNCRVFTFSNQIMEVPPYRGLAGIDAIITSQAHVGTYLGNALETIHRDAGPHDRIIVITDEQSHDRVPDPIAKHAYMINVASAKNGVGYGRWTHIDGFSEGVLRYIHAIEQE